ncbi:DUF4310 family protein [Salmonella enterica subsp. enterica]|nr:DUF4310 family protein [Salmonella enterica subsp. enterica]
MARRLATSLFLARKFTINQERLHVRGGRHDGAGNTSGRFLGPLIILSAMTASTSLVWALVALPFYISAEADYRRRDF